jgi:hypothetical protein
MFEFSPGKASDLELLKPHREAFIPNRSQMLALNFLMKNLGCVFHIFMLKL